MAVNKVEFGGRTLMDLTEDTVSEENLLEGETAHNAKGEKVIGGAKVPGKLSQLENDMDFRPIMHITKQEYESLPEDKLTDGKVYLIEDESPESNVVGLVDINEAINGVVLWENPDPSAEFPAQTVTLSDDIEKYEFVEVEFAKSGRLNATGKIKFVNSMMVRLCSSDYYNYLRTITFTNGRSASISDATFYGEYGKSSSVASANGIIIPTRFIGYPKADFSAIDGVIPDAKSVSYDNANSGLVAENVQDAVDLLTEYVNPEYEIIDSIENVSNSIQVLSFFVEKKRDIVHFTLYVHVKDYIGENDLLFYLPKGFRPKRSYYMAGILYLGALESENKYPYARLRESGSVAISAVPGQYIMIDTTYIAGY